MNITKRQPFSVGEMITEEFLVPMALTQGQFYESASQSSRNYSRQFGASPLRDIRNLRQMAVYETG